MASGSDDDEPVLLTTENSTALIANVLGLLLVKGHNNTEAIKILARAGYTKKHIAALLNTTPDTVKVTLYEARKKPKGGGHGKGKGQR